MAGVSTGLAEHLGAPVLAVRITFIVATWFNGAGIVAYLLLWRFMALEQTDRSPGLESATRRGLRTRSRPGLTDVMQGVALGAIGVGVLVFLQTTGRGISGSLLAPVLVAIVGVAVIWRQFDDASLGRWITRTSGVTFAARVGVGVGMVALSGVYVVTQDRGWSAVVDLGSAVLIALLGGALILGPWLYQLMSDLGDERRARVRSQERADVAAHLHDSVLQTLALLQKNPDDPAQVATLARRQERELRAWLYGTDETIGESFAASLRGTAAEVEDAHQVAIETVVVGDVALDADVAAMVRAAREAMVNAAKHARVGRIDVYAETDGQTAEVFVRDRGVGFDLDQVSSDRMGVRASILERVQRHGGTAEIRTAPGQGTEVRLAVDVRRSTDQTTTRGASS